MSLGHALYVMKFAINYSEPSEQLLNSGDIYVDLFKCPSWDDLVPKVHQAHAAYVHFGFIAGRNQLADVDFGWIENWLKTTDTCFVNTHIAVRQSDFAPDDSITTGAIIEKIVQDVEFLGARFGNERIIIENIPYPDPGWHDDLLPEAVDPYVISEVVEQTGCGLLLDIAHAIRTCEGLGNKDVKAYINAMPTHALRELHVVGILPYEDENGVRQDHYELLDADWKMVEWAISQIRDNKWRIPDVMAFEYGGVGDMFVHRCKRDVIAKQAPRLYKLVQSVQT